MSPTDKEKADFFEGVLENMEKVANDLQCPMQELVVTYSKATQPNGLPEFYKIERRVNQ